MTRHKGTPPLVYGTAFAFEHSADLVHAALRAGFRGVDTAGAKRAYREALVGEGIVKAMDDGVVTRGDIWVRFSISISISTSSISSHALPPYI